MVKTVKVHEDTHRALKRLKVEERRRSLDEVIRAMVRATTGSPVQAVGKGKPTRSLTSYAEE